MRTGFIVSILLLLLSTNTAIAGIGVACGTCSHWSCEAADTIRQLQRALISAGATGVRADGSYGSGTQAALYKFAVSKGLLQEGLSPDESDRKLGPRNDALISALFPREDSKAVKTAIRQNWTCSGH